MNGITLRDVLKFMDDFNRVTIVLSKQEVQVFPLFVLEFFKNSILGMKVVQIDGNKIFIERGNHND